MYKKIIYSSILILFTATILTGCSIFRPKTNNNIPTSTPTTIVPTNTPIPTATSPIISIDDNSFKITITEEQATRYANKYSTEIKEPKVEDISVSFQNGTVAVTGKVEQSGLLLPFELEIKLTANGTIIPDYQIITAKVGPFNLPEEMVDQLATSLIINLQNNYLPKTSKVSINKIESSNGILTISGVSIK